MRVSRKVLTPEKVVEDNILKPGKVILADSLPAFGHDDTNIYELRLLTTIPLFSKCIQYELVVISKLLLGIAIICRSTSRKYHCLIAKPITKT